MRFERREYPLLRPSASISVTEDSTAIMDASINYGSRARPKDRYFRLVTWNSTLGTPPAICIRSLNLHSCALFLSSLLKKKQQTATQMQWAEDFAVWNKKQIWQICLIEIF